MIKRWYKVVGLSSQLGARHVQQALLSVPGVRSARVHRTRHEVVVGLDHPVSLTQLNNELAGSEEGYLLLPQYQRPRQAAGLGARLRRLLTPARS